MIKIHKQYGTAIVNEQDRNTQVKGIIYYDESIELISHSLKLLEFTLVGVQNFKVNYPNDTKYRQKFGLNYEDKESVKLFITYLLNCTQTILNAV